LKTHHAQKFLTELKRVHRRNWGGGEEEKEAVSEVPQKEKEGDLKTAAKTRSEARGAGKSRRERRILLQWG